MPRAYSPFVSRAQAAVTIELLADRPELVVPLARIRWREWHGHPGREQLLWWIDTTRREAGQGGLPVTFVAIDAGDAVGGVGIVRLPEELPELAERGPWVVGTIVRADRRGQGIGSALMTRLMRWATEAGLSQLWVATGGPAIDFYRRCGFTLSEVVHLSNGDRPALLTARLPTRPSPGLPTGVPVYEDEVRDPGHGA